MKKLSIALIGGLLLLGLACGGGGGGGGEGYGEQTEEPQAAAPAALPEQVQLAVDVKKAVEADPDRTAEILEEHGLTADEFEQLLYDIAADPALSKAYKQAIN